MATTKRVNHWVDGFAHYQRIAVMDTETTDRYWNSCAPIQIAAIICDHDGNVLGSFNERIKTTHQIKEEASKVHGIYAKDLVNCRREKDVLTDFCVWLQSFNVDCVLTYNGEAFDRRMLQKRCEVLKISFNYFNQEIFPGIDGYYDCILDAKRQNYCGLKDALGAKWRLSMVAEHFHIDSDGAHDALEDVIMLKKIFWLVDPKIHPSRWTTGAPTKLF